MNDEKEERSPKIYKSIQWYGMLKTKDGLSAKCPICGVTSNLWPDFKGSLDTSITQRLSYCGHKAEGYFQIREEI